MMVKLSETFFVDADSIETARYCMDGGYGKSAFEVTFKHNTPIRLVGAEADEAWATWTAIRRYAG
jgi:hypothetical protein